MKTILLSIIFLFTLSACAGSLNYNILDNYMKTGSCPLAAEYVKKHEKDYGSNERLLFLLDSAMIDMLCGNYEESSRYFQSAEDLAGDLWTKSFTKETASFLVNDYTIPYAGEDFERALIYLFSAINYAMPGQYDEALVEIRRLDLNLRAINDKYEEKNVYKEDAFARYLSGIMYEADNNLDDAYIDYYKARQAFKDYKRDYGTPVPRILLEDLFRVAGAVNRTEDIRSVLHKFDDLEWLKQGEVKGLGKVVFIHFNGSSPVKRESKLFVPLKDGPLTIAFPRYEVKPPACRSSRVIAESGTLRIEAESELVEDINKIAVKNLKDRSNRVIAKTAARVAAKQVAIRSVTKNETARTLLNIANIFIEKADTRTWRTLPGEIYLSRLFLPEGQYSVYINRCGQGDEAVESVNLKAGETKFILFES
ncbi:MAG TPA: hypothetical protein ENG83_03925 [Nitrospirae bacterium]|nr:hypothetical protein BMS3Abin06_01916 [bacterium BMS3Abin06]HDH11343.1 hypothetical protein [Nitrospirota bacterium]HDZ00079.1 hypothetical protein [Nitrospirota bacterium]